MTDYNSSYTGAQIDNAVAAGLAVRGVNGLVKSNGSGTISAIDDPYFENTSSALWTSGGLSSSTGATSSSTTRIRTDMLSPFGVKKVTPTSGYKVAVYVYDSSGTYQGIWNGTTAEKTANWIIDPVDFSVLPAGSQIRLLGAASNDSTIGVDASTNFPLLCYTDRSGTVLGAPADAGVVDELFRYRGALGGGSGANANSLTDFGVYRWTTNGTPTNAPESIESSLMVFAPNASTSRIAQLVITSNGHTYTRYMNGSGSWQSWHQLGDAVKIDTITTTTTWSGSDPYTQTVTLGTNTPTSNTVVRIQIDDSTYNQLESDGVKLLRIDNNNGTLTAVARGAAPTAALTLQVTLTEGVS